MKRTDTPGPGQYNYGQLANFKFAYTKEPRSKEMKKGEPGPGRKNILKQSMRFRQVYQVPLTT